MIEQESQKKIRIALEQQIGALVLTTVEQAARIEMLEAYTATLQAQLESALKDETTMKPRVGE